MMTVVVIVTCKKIDLYCLPLLFLVFLWFWYEDVSFEICLVIKVKKSIALISIRANKRLLMWLIKYECYQAVS